MHEALEISHKKLEVEKKQILFLKNHFKKGLIEIFPNVHFNGNSSENNLSTYTLLNVALPIDEKKASLLDFHLDLKGIACSKGSACQSGSSQGSHVLNHIQNQKIKKMSSLRFSFSSFNNIDEVDYVLETLKEFVTQ
jgi:cysteine desulfurase